MAPQVVNYTNKTQFLFRIEKGVLDINDPGVNESFAPEDIRVPFRNMIYIGDSDTDIPCMKLVLPMAHSIGVYNADTLDKTKVYKMMREGGSDTLHLLIIRRYPIGRACESDH